jgi:hypothetical protein
MGGPVCRPPSASKPCGHRLGLVSPIIFSTSAEAPRRRPFRHLNSFAFPCRQEPPRPFRLGKGCPPEVEKIIGVTKHNHELFQRHRRLAQCTARPAPRGRGGRRPSGKSKVKSWSHTGTAWRHLEKMPKANASRGRAKSAKQYLQTSAHCTPPWTGSVTQTKQRPQPRCFCFGGRSAGKDDGRDGGSHPPPRGNRTTWNSF